MNFSAMVLLLVSSCSFLVVSAKFWVEFGLWALILCLGCFDIFGSLMTCVAKKIKRTFLKPSANF